MRGIRRGIAGVLFDMDGVILDATPYRFLAWFEFRGAAAVLGELDARGYRLALVTGTPRAPVTTMLPRGTRGTAPGSFPQNHPCVGRRAIAVLSRRERSPRYPYRSCRRHAGLCDCHQLIEGAPPWRTLPAREHHRGAPAVSA